MIKGIVFDMDDTLVQSFLDFDHIKKVLNIPKDQFILEFIENAPSHAKKSLNDRLLELEIEAAKKSIPMPGINKVLETLQQKDIKIAVLTRNTILPTKIILEKFQVKFDPIFTRDCCLPKPNPDGLIQIAKQWNFSVKEILMVGDSSFDIDVAKNANMKVVFYNPSKKPHHFSTEFEIHDYKDFFNCLHE